jgi:hypothetical protein
MIRDAFLHKGPDSALLDGGGVSWYDGAPHTPQKHMAWMELACKRGANSTLHHLVVDLGIDPELPLKIDDAFKNSITEYEDADVEYVEIRPLALVIEFAHTPHYRKCIELLLRAGANPLHTCYENPNDERSMDAFFYLLESMRAWLYHAKFERLQLQLEILALLLDHVKATPQELPFAAASANDVKQELPLDIAIMLGAMPTEHTEYVCWNAVSMLLECKHLCIHTRLGALNTALRHVTSTAFCMRLCQKLLAAGVRVNETSSLRDLTTDAFLFLQFTPLVTATLRPGPDCLVFTHMLLDVPHANPNLLVGNQEGVRQTCLCTAAQHPTHARPLVRLLLSYGADPFLPIIDTVTLLDELHASNAAAAALVLDVMQSDASFMPTAPAKKKQRRSL